MTTRKPDDALLMHAPDATFLQKMPLRWPLTLAVGAALVALAGRVAVPLPGTPVPFTLQGLAVLLVGGLFGGAAAFGSMMLYLLLGAFGAPVFALGGAGVARLVGPTGGYLLAFPIGAAITGRLAVRGSVLRSTLAALLGLAAIHLGGLAVLTILSRDPIHAFMVGSLPFLLPDLLKALAAGVILSRFAAALRPRA